MKKYSVVNFKSPNLYIFFLIILALLALVLLIILKSDSFWLREFALIPILLAFASLVCIFTSKVVVDDTFITKKTIFRTQSIKIEEIKLFGVMKLEGELGVRILEESEFNTADWIFSKTIFISRDQDYDPLSYKQKGTITIHYQKDLYVDILQKIAECKRSRYS